jgi:prepilin-type N-terminal cleavage/methylation domain-containing protein
MKNSTPHKQPAAARGFTLIEILVVMGIIVVLIALLAPMLSKTFRKGAELRSQADLNSISLALEAYRQDFGDIPRTSGPNTGAATLCKALIGPYGTASTVLPYDVSKSYKAGECVTSAGVSYVALQNPGNVAPPDPLTWAVFNPVDGADGPGFKVRTGAALSGPYMDPSKLKSQGSYLLDSYGHPILYFPARPGRVNVNQGTPLPMYVARYYKGDQPNPAALFNADDNFEAYRRSGETNDHFALGRIQMMFGDYRDNGFIESAESETAITLPYVLVSAGPDGVFGPGTVKGFYKEEDPASPPVPPSGGAVSSEDGKLNRAAVTACDDVMNVQK